MEWGWDSKEKADILKGGLNSRMRVLILEWNLYPEEVAANLDLEYSKGGVYIETWIPNFGIHPIVGLES